MDGQTDQDLDALWNQVLQAWDDPKAHDRFLQACHERSRLGYAAAKYRLLAEEAPEISLPSLPAPQLRQTEVQKRLTAITVLATQALDASRGERRHPGQRWLAVAAAGLLVGALIWAAYALTR
jgi:hypothetical protein